MKPALILVDLQLDFLSAPPLQPAAGAITERAAALLAACRTLGCPVVHVLTTTHRERDDRMPHWKAVGKRSCESGTPGHAPPQSLTPIAGEAIIEKQFFSGFENPQLDLVLEATGCDTVILAGVHLHGCVRATALDAYQRGYEIWIAEDAVGSDDPLHAAITRRWMTDRSARFLGVATIDRALRSGASQPSESIEHRSPVDMARVLWTVPIASSRQIADATTIARRAFVAGQSQSMESRASALRSLADQLTENAEELAQLITQGVGKPITMARAEVRRSVAILHAVADQANVPTEVASGPNARFRHQPLGVVGIITPWNNPLAIPIGRLAPAALFGNSVVWKPAPAGTMIARRLCELLSRANWRAQSSDWVQLIAGDHSTACALAADPQVDGVTLSGSLRAGYALQEISARRHIPFQAELGGNNAAIVWDDADISASAAQVASAAFGFAGQRCTANRRVIVASSIYDQFVAELERATALLKWGDPSDVTTVVGPLISVAKRDEVAALVERARAIGLDDCVPHRGQSNYAELMGKGAYWPPTILLARDSDSTAEVVQEESFGPVLVVQRASNFDQALEKLNGVSQGLVAALFSDSPELRHRFSMMARAGVLKFDAGTSDADASSPLGGWKASGVGPAEHGPCDREFFCRVQTIYNA